MGLYINYKGKLKSPSLVPEIVAELEDICKTMNWPYEKRDDDWTKVSDIIMRGDSRDNTLEVFGEAYLKGIVFRPMPDYDPIDMTFDKKGNLTNNHQIMWENLKIKELKPSTFLWSKTSFAPDYVHVGVCKLFRHLSKKYFKTFKVKDDTGFWESNDKNLLKMNQDMMKTLVSTFSAAMEKDGVTFLEKLGISLKGI